MKVGLFVTCLVDQMWSSIGASSVAVLRRAGCEVTFDERQTCCGQPAFNTGYRSEARRVAERFIELCEDSKVDAIVSPSGSCTAMIRHYQSLFADDERWRVRADKVGGLGLLMLGARAPSPALSAKREQYFPCFTQEI